MTIENTEILIKGAAFFNLTIKKEQVDIFNRYYCLLQEWNQKMNLTAIIEERDVVIKHFIDSLSMLSFLPHGFSKLIDVGTGAGFPGIPVKIVCPEVSVTLLDSLEKRIRFLDNAIRELELRDINAIHGRAEDFSRQKAHRENYDAGVARAVAALPVLCEYILPFIKQNGVFLAMKGSEIQKELSESERAITLLGGKIIKVHSFMLPFEKMKRNIVLIKKVQQTPTEYPRKSGKPTKFPLLSSRNPSN